VAHLHKKFTAEQVRVLIQAYCQGAMARAGVEGVLGIGKTRFFALLKQYREDPNGLTLDHVRSVSGRLSAAVETEIRMELLREKALIDDPSLPIKTYNYSAMKDRLDERDIQVSVPTIIARAKTSGCYLPPMKIKHHDRQVVTTAIGTLVQHDASYHRWSPFAEYPWVLITSLDDYSRKLLYADFVEKESTWDHIKAAEILMRSYGLPLRYYVDSLRVFRFVRSRDSVWIKQVLQTDEADPQWRQVMRVLEVDVTYALSPQAKGKIERPYRWLQDRIVRTCALEKLATIEEARGVLRYEVSRYNNHQAHSTTGEIPSLRFENAMSQGISLFRPSALPKPYTSTKDIFCLRERRTVNGYRRITLYNHEIEVRNVPLWEEVELHLIPDPSKGVLDIRIWWENKLVHTVTYPRMISPGMVPTAIPTMSYPW
jgi:hypothetical protein